MKIIYVTKSKNTGQEPGSFSMGYIKVGNKTKKRQVVLFKKFSQFEVHGFSRGRAEVLVSEWFIKKAWLGVWLVSIIARRRRLMCMSRWHRNRAYTIEMWNISLILRYALQRTEVGGMCSVCADLLKKGYGHNEFVLADVGWCGCFADLVLFP